MDARLLAALGQAPAAAEPVALPETAEAAAEAPWPDAAAEAAVRSELLARDARPEPVAPPAFPIAGNLPSLDTLVARLPAETRAALDELFRAKFSSVRRLRESDLPAGK